MHRAYRSATLDIIISYCFAKDYQVVHVPGFAHQLVLDYEMVIPIGLILKNFPWLYYALIFIGRANKALLGSKEGSLSDIEQTMSRQIDELLADRQMLAQAEHETIYHHLLTPHPGKGVYGKVPPKKGLMDEAQSMLAAGSDTVGNTSTMGTCFILSHPEVHSRLVEELKEAWPDKEIEMRYSELEKLPYLVSALCLLSYVHSRGRYADCGDQGVASDVAWRSHACATHCRSYGRNHRRRACSCRGM